MSELAERQPQATAATVDWEAALRYLQLNPKDPKAQALVLVSEKYGLDPLLGHVSLYEGKPYIHYSAYLHLANSNPHYAGSECVREWEDDDFYYATVRVHRDDRDFPAERTGRSRKLKPKKGGGTYRDDTADAKAFAQAHRRALRLAFNVEMPEPDDHGDTPAPEPVVEVARMVQETSPPSRPGKAGGGDSTSGEGERPPGLKREVRDDPSPDSNVFATAAEDGDALPDDDNGEGSADHGEPPDSTSASLAGGAEGEVSGTAGYATADPDPSPVQLWCDENNIDIRMAKVYLRKGHPREFQNIQDWRDVQELRGEQAALAIKRLDQWLAGAKPDREGG